MEAQELQNILDNKFDKRIFNSEQDIINEVNQVLGETALTSYEVYVTKESEYFARIDVYVTAAVSTVTDENIYRRFKAKVGIMNKDELIAKSADAFPYYLKEQR